MRSVTRLLPAAVVVLMLTPATARAPWGFDDVAPGTWYEEPVAWLVENEITTGVEPGCFAPYDTVTRGQVAAFLFRLDAALGGSPTGAAHPFLDVVTDYQQTPVAWLAENGITTGTSPITYSPDDPITRGQFAVLLWRYAGRPEAATPHPFVDVATPWQETAIAWLAETGITTGTSEVTFSPDSQMTRAEAATFVWRFASTPVVEIADEDVPCSRELRFALVDAGLTSAEATCAIDYLNGYTVQELTDVLIGDAYPPADMIVTISAAATSCLTPDRVDELTELIF